MFVGFFPVRGTPEDGPLESPGNSSLQMRLIFRSSIPHSSVDPTRTVTCQYAIFPSTICPRVSVT
jgi:hypothetical protein